MTSRIKTLFFNEKLAYNTRLGNPIFMGPLNFFLLFFEQTNNFFYGAFSESEFKLTNNSYYRIPFYIKGTYRQKNDQETEVDYEMKTNYYRFFWIHLTTVACLIMNLPQIILSEIDSFVFIRSIIVLMFLSRYFFFYEKKKELENRFIEDFEIQN